MSWIVYLRLCEHIHQPAADCAIRAACYQVVGVLGTDHLHGIDRVRVAGC